MTSLLSSPKTGLLVQQRVVNLPGTLVPLLHQALMDDIQFAKTEVCTRRISLFLLSIVVFK